MEIAENISLKDLKVMFKLENCRGNLYLVMPSLVLFASHHPSCLRPRWGLFFLGRTLITVGSRVPRSPCNFPTFLFSNSYLRLPGPYIFLSWRQKVLIDSRKIKGRTNLAHSTYGRLSYYFFPIAWHAIWRRSISLSGWKKICIQLYPLQKNLSSSHVIYPWKQITSRVH